MFCVIQVVGGIAIWSVVQISVSVSTPPFLMWHDGTWAVVAQARARRACGAGRSRGWGRDSGRDVIRAQSVSLAFGSLVFKLPESTWSGVVVDESRCVLDVAVTRRS